MSATTISGAADGYYMGSGLYGDIRVRLCGYAHNTNDVICGSYDETFHTYNSEFFSNTKSGSYIGNGYYNDGQVTVCGEGPYHCTGYR